MKHTLLALLFAPALAAQSYYVYTPPFATAAAGSGSSTVMYGSASHDSRTQQVDSNWIGSPLLPSISAVAFRHDESADPTDSARTMDIEIRMSHSNYATFGTTFANNPSDTPVVVLPRQMVNIPARTALPTSLFDFDPPYPFAVPFFPNATDAILLDILVFDALLAIDGSALDFYNTGLPTIGYGQTHLDRGDGCSTVNGRFKSVHGFTSTPSTMTLSISVTGAPASTALTMLMGSPLLFAIPVPGLCAPLGTDATFSIPIGTTGTLGAIPPFTASAAFSPLAGWMFSMQAAALDASQVGIPIALSNSTLTSLPRTAGTTSIGVKRTFRDSDVNAATGTAVGMTAVATRYSI